jgi:hemolysin III
VSNDHNNLKELIKSFREPVSGLTHFSAALVSLLGLAILLIKGWGNGLQMMAFLIYSTSLVLMFSASAVYHLTDSSNRVISVLRKLDHTAIYLLIAGTYTPICLLFFNGFWQIGLLSIVWAFAFAGIVVKLFTIHAPRWVTAGIYLVMGWLCILAIGEIVRTIPQGAIIWLVLGGLFYTFGAVIYMTKKMDFKPGIFGFHEVWHVFVILGAFSHFLMIAFFA